MNWTAAANLRNTLALFAVAIIVTGIAVVVGYLLAQQSAQRADFARRPIDEVIDGESRLRLVARDVAPERHPVVGVLGEELEPLLVPALVEELGLPVQEVLDLLPDEEPREIRRGDAHRRARSSQLAASMSWRHRV